jgi:proline dehydrogenase
VAENKIKNTDFEFQMLYGIRNKTQRQLAADGYRVRTYVPFGTHWIPYFYRRLRERKENVFFLAKNLFKK